MFSSVPASIVLLPSTILLPHDCRFIPEFASRFNNGCDKLFPTLNLIEVTLRVAKSYAYDGVLASITRPTRRSHFEQREHYVLLRRPAVVRSDTARQTRGGLL